MHIYVIFIAFAILSFIVQQVLKSKFEKYSQITLPSGLTGREVAEKMLREHNIHSLIVVNSDGQLVGVIDAFSCI